VAESGERKQHAALVVAVCGDKRRINHRQHTDGQSSVNLSRLHRGALVTPPPPPDREAEHCDEHVCVQWRNDGVTAASSDGGPTGGRGPRQFCFIFNQRGGALT